MHTIGRRRVESLRLQPHLMARDLHALNNNRDFNGPEAGYLDDYQVTCDSGGPVYPQHGADFRAELCYSGAQASPER
ncbi:MAG: hypothetical protein AB1486_32875 [Planctomycetota bacterium]